MSIGQSVIPFFVGPGDEITAAVLLANGGGEPIDTSIDPEFLARREAALACIDTCQRRHVEYFRSTLDRRAYLMCLENCNQLPPTIGLPESSWPSDLLRAVGEDVQAGAAAVSQAIGFPLFLLAVIAVAVALTVRRIT